jgi:hypothetical protein
MTQTLRQTVAPFSGAKVRKTSDQTDISGSPGITTKVTWDSSDYDTDSYFDNANDRLTVPAAGYYRVTAAVHLYNFAATTFEDGILRLNKNGSIHTYLYRLFGASASGMDIRAATLFGSTVLFLAASDYLEIAVTVQATGGSNVVDIRAADGSSNPFTWFEIQRVDF